MRSPRRRSRLRTALLILGGAVGAFLIAGLGIGCGLSAPHYRGPRSDHFDGERFQNMQPRENGGFWRFVKWQWSREPGPWTRRQNAPGAPPPGTVNGGRLRVTWVNHATTLVQMDGINLLSDPIWSERASPFSWVGPKRYQAPGIRFEDLPPIHAVVVSHNHYDHCDVPTLRRLAQTHRPRIFVGLGVGGLLKREGITGVTELDWWQEARLTDTVQIVGAPAQHFSGRGLTDRDRNLWMSYVMRGPSGRVYFGGDTGAGPHFAEVRRRLGEPRLAILPIGAFQPIWFMAPVHVSPQEAVEAAEQLGARQTLGMHFGTFALADDGQDEPVTALQAALAKRGNTSPPFWVLGFGEGRDVP